MSLSTSDLTDSRNAKLDIIMEDDDCSLMQAMLPIYEKMRAVKG